jgi:undecaprenyl-diphosphatase
MLLATSILVAFFFLAWGGVHLALPFLWRVFARAARGFARLAFGSERLSRWRERGVARFQPLHPYRRALVIGALGFLAAAVVGAAFLDLAEEVRASSPTLQRIDHHMWELARSHRTDGRTVFFLAFTYLGTPVGLGAVVLATVAGLAARGFRRLPVFLVASSLSSWGLNALLKVVFERARPDLTLALRTSSGYSFPSGHAMMSLCTFGALLYVAARISDQRRVQSLCAAAALTVVLAIGASRVYLGVHWTSDIAGGWAAGLVWLAASIATYEVFRRLRLLRSAAGRRRLAEEQRPA